MQIKTSVDGNKATMHVAGKLTVQTSPDLNAAIEDLPRNVNELVIDLERVEYIASAGLRVLVAADKMVVRRGGSLVLQHPVDDVMEVLEMTGLADVFNIER